MKRFWAALAALSCVGPASAQLSLGTTDASNGAFNHGNLTLNLADATVGAWDSPAVAPLRGVYDPVRFAVVYKFSSFNLTGNLGFSRHPQNPPVVILVQGNATINGTIFLDASFEHAGPGGFAGGPPGAPSTNTPGAAGSGPGGGQASNNVNIGAGTAAYGTMPSGIPPNIPASWSGKPYGNEQILPLLGGSGGGSYQSVPGGGGGGAILIAATGTITLNGTIFARGTQGWQVAAGAGSGGAIRLIANQVTGVGQLLAAGGSTQAGTGGVGRIRIERNISSFITGLVNPQASYGVAGPVAKLWPDNLNPLVTIASIATAVPPSDPLPAFIGTDLEVGNDGPQRVVVHTQNVPVDGSWMVLLRVNQRFGGSYEVPLTLHSGNPLAGVWEGFVTFVDGQQTLQARAFRL